jgi:hypothetical protein
MSTVAPAAGLAGASPQFKARLAGIVYLLNILTGAAAAILGGRGHTGYGDAANLVATACYLVVTWLFYDLFKPVSKGVSLLAALFSLVGCAMGALNALHLTPLHINNLVFFGGYCVLIGYLILRSLFLPRILGVVMLCAGLGWLTFLSPSLAGRLSPYNLAPGVLGETLLTLWLLARGIDVQHWNEQASAAAR